MKSFRMYVVALTSIAMLGSGCVQDAVNTDEIDVGTAQNALSLGLDWAYGRIVVNDDFIGPNDTTIRYKWYEHLGHDEAFVIFLNGRTEFVEKYDPMFTSLNELPWETSEAQTLADLPVTFFAMDHQGQGLSGGLPSHIDGYDIFVENLRALIDRVWKLELHRRPIYLMARSMGSLIATRFAQEYPEYVDGLILGSPMFGINAPAGVTPEQLRMLAGAFAAPAPYGFGFADRCAVTDRLPVPILGALAQCLPNEGCAACFADPSQDGCPELPWTAMNEAWAFLNSPDSIGCPYDRNPEYNCTFPGEGFNGTTSDYAYCYWMETNPIAGPKATFGWIYESFNAIDVMNEPEKLEAIKDIPTLVLSSPIDPIVTASTHGAFCNALNDCDLVEFQSDFANGGPYYFHELFAETNRAAVISEVHVWLDEIL